MGSQITRGNDGHQDVLWMFCVLKQKLEASGEGAVLELGKTFMSLKDSAAENQRGERRATRELKPTRTEKQNVE